MRERLLRKAKFKRHLPNGGWPLSLSKIRWTSKAIRDLERIRLFLTVPDRALLFVVHRIGHVFYREGQMRKELGFAVFEPELAVPALQFGVFANDANADGLD